MALGYCWRYASGNRRRLGDCDVPTRSPPSFRIAAVTLIVSVVELMSAHEAAYLESARNDPRIMAELDAAILRSEKVEATSVAVVQANPVARKVVAPMAAFEARKIPGSYLRNF